MASASLIGAIWGLGYAFLGRPVSAAVPGGAALIAAAACAWLLISRRLGRLRELVLAMMLVLPALLQVTLGGYVKGSAVVMWAFIAPLGALVFFGSRAALPWLTAFFVAVGATTVADPWLSGLSPSLPTEVEIALFAFNISGLAALVTVALAFFRTQRDEAMARSESLLLNVLPPEIAVRLKRQEYPIADRFEDVSVLFADLVGFTVRSAAEPPEVTVTTLNEFFSAFDLLASGLGLRPIRTTGDCYLVVGGLPVPTDGHCEAIAEMALGMLQVIDALNRRHGWDVNFRIGINTGPAMAAVVGRHRFAYDVWSDAVNTASRMETTGVPGRIQVTEATYLRLRSKYRFEPRGELDVKGKGRMKTFFLIGPRRGAPALMC
jgi:guanylate cyclase